MKRGGLFWIFSLFFYLNLGFLMGGLAFASVTEKTSDGAATEPVFLPLLSEVLNWSDEMLLSYLGQPSPMLAKCLDTNPLKACLDKRIFLAGHQKQVHDNRSILRSKIRQFSKEKPLERYSLAAYFLFKNKTCDQSTIDRLALATILEQNFPDPEAILWTSHLLKDVVQCENFEFRDEALIRLSLILALKGQKKEGIQFLQKVSHQSLNIRDRSLYLRRLLGEDINREYLESLRPVPLGMYGYLLLGDREQILTKKSGGWRIQSQPADEMFKDFLPALAYLYRKNLLRKVENEVVNHVDFDLLRRQPHSYQIAVGVLFHRAGYDLPVFKILHQVLADNPNLASQEVIPLLFPVRYWDEISKGIQNMSELNPVLIKSLIRQESAFSPLAMSQAHAVGLMQIIPSTAKKLGLSDTKQLFNPEKNIQLGVQYFRNLLLKYGSVDLALAAYNAGPKKVDEWKKRYPVDDLELFIELIPYRETREYIRLIRRNEAIYKMLLSEIKNL